MSRSLQRVLEENARSIATNAELIAEHTNDWQTIQAYLARRVAGIVLSPKQQEKMKRYEWAYNQLISGKYSEREVGDMLTEVFGVDITQAMRDLRDARELFATTLSVNKAFELKLQLELNARYQRMAEAKGDLRALANFEKNAIKLKDMIQEEDKGVGEDFTPHINEFVFNPELLGIKPIAPESLGQLYKDLRSQFGMGGIPEAEEIEFEDLKHDGNTADSL